MKSGLNDAVMIGCQIHFAIQKVAKAGVVDTIQQAALVCFFGIEKLLPCLNDAANTPRAQPGPVSQLLQTDGFSGSRQITDYRFATCMARQ